MNSVIHPEGCVCMECLAWYRAMLDGKVSGRCQRCQKPVDDHPKDNHGRIQTCA